MATAHAKSNGANNGAPALCEQPAASSGTVIESVESAGGHILMGRY